MDREAIVRFIGYPQRQGLQRALQVVIRRLRQSGRIDHSPAGAGPQVAQKQHQGAATPGTRAPPFGEARRHHLAAGRPGQPQVAVVIGIAQRRRVQAVQHPLIVFAHVVEIPAGTEVARHPFLPARMVAAQRALPPSSDKVSASGTLAKARHSDAKRTSTGAASSSGRSKRRRRNTRSRRRWAGAERRRRRCSRDSTARPGTTEARAPPARTRTAPATSSRAARPTWPPAGRLHCCRTARRAPAGPAAGQLLARLPRTVSRNAGSEAG